MHRHCLAQLIHSADPVSIAVGRQSDQSLALNHALLERRKILVNRFGINSTEKRIAMATYCFNLQLTAGKKTLDPVATRSMHRVNNYRSFRRPYPIEINIRSNL